MRLGKCATRTLIRHTGFRSHRTGEYHRIHESGAHTCPSGCCLLSRLVLLRVRMCGLMPTFVVSPAGGADLTADVRADRMHDDLGPTRVHYKCQLIEAPPGSSFIPQRVPGSRRASQMLQPRTTKRVAECPTHGDARPQCTVPTHPVRHPAPPDRARPGPLRPHGPARPASPGPAPPRPSPNMSRDAACNPPRRRPEREAGGTCKGPGRRPGRVGAGSTWVGEGRLSVKSGWAGPGRLGPGLAGKSLSES